MPKTKMTNDELLIAQLTYHVIAISKFRFRVVKQGYSLPLRNGIVVFEFVSKSMTEGEALDHAQYLNTGIKPERRAQ